MKIGCSKCKTEKDVSEFGIRPSRPRGYHSWCLLCVRNANKKYVGRYNESARSKRKEDQRRFKGYQLKKTYGLSVEDWENLFDSQNRKCAICESDTANNKRGWGTDHDHKTGLVRGILCSKCNVLLGMANDNLNILQKAIEYLTKHGDTSYSRPK